MALIEPSIGSSTTHVAPPRTDAELLGDEREVAAVGVEARHDRLLDRGVDRRRVVAAHPRADDRLAIRARGQLGEHAADVLDRGAAGRQPVSQGGGRAAPEVSLG